MVNHTITPGPASVVRAALARQILTGRVNMSESDYGYMDRFAPDDYRLRLTVRLDLKKYPPYDPPRKRAIAHIEECRRHSGIR